MRLPLQVRPAGLARVREFFTGPSGSARTARADAPPQARAARQTEPVLAGAARRLESMMRDGLRIEGRLGIVSGNELANLVPRPELALPFTQAAYTELETALASARESLRHLDGLPAAALTGPNATATTVKTLVRAVLAQHQVAGAAKEFQKLSGESHPELVRIIADSQARAAELLNVAARLRVQGQAPAAPGQSVRAAAEQASLNMHGTAALLDNLARVGEPLFARVERLAQVRYTMEPEAFAAELLATRQELGALQARVDGLLAPDAGETPALAGDGATFGALRRRLAAADSRLDELAGRPDYAEVARNYARALAETPGLTTLAADLPLPEGILTRLDLLDRGSEDIGHTLESHAGTAFSPAALARGIIGRQGDFKSDWQMCRAFTALALADADAGTTRTIAEHSSRLMRRLPFLSSDQAHTLAAGLARTVDSLLPDPEGRNRLEQLHDTLNHSFFSLSPAQIRSETRELERLAARGEAAELHRGEFIARAFANTFSLATLTEANARGIDPDCVDFSAHDGALVGTPVELGSGACNTVLLCTYRDARGERIERVFKGEVPARRGLGRLRLGKLGYDPLARVAQINVATMRAAQAIGCGDVVTQATVGVHAGRFGLFMAAAPGKTAAQFDDFEDDEFTAPVATFNGVDMTPSQLLDHLQSTGRMATARANLQRELNRLEWVDILCGQGDRHQSNYLVHINPASGAVRVTGIDNDAAFGHLMVGAAKVDVSSDAYAAVHDLAEKVTVDGAPRRIVDMAGLNDNDKARMRDVFGFNQMFVPALIDRPTYDTLMRVQEDEYAAALSRHLDSRAVEAAVSRLRDAQNLAERLRDAGRVVTDWEQDRIHGDGGESLLVTEFLKHRRTEALAGGDSASLGFYGRDFGAAWE